MKKTILVSLFVLLSACSKQQPENKNPATSETAKISAECQNLLDTMEKLAKNDENIAKEMQTNTQAFHEDWAQLNDEEKKTYSEKCAKINDSLLSLNK